MVKFYYFIHSLWLISCFELSHQGHCPPSENISPKCFCRNLGDGPMMGCKGIVNAEELVAPIKETEGHDMFSLALIDSILLYLPDKIFNGTNYKKIRLMNTELMSLSESGVGFEYLEDSLEEFRVMDANYVTQWVWTDIRFLKKITLIEVDQVSLGSINQPFPTLNSLTALAVTRADLSFLHYYSFSNLENLRILNLKENRLNDLRRSILPYPAKHLMILDLSGNDLHALPEDIFQGMPILSDLNLDNNKLVTLPQNVFGAVFRAVNTLSIQGNNIRCDCRLRWIVDEKQPMEFNAVCSMPETLKGVHLRSLVPKVLWC